MIVSHYDSVLKNALEAFGPKHQLLKVIEEMSELQVELSKHLAGEGDRSALVDELADTIITLRQLELYLDAEKELTQHVNFKVSRLLERIEKSTNTPEDKKTPKKPTKLGQVLSVFAGCGKTYCAKKYPNKVIDLESSDYKWIYAVDVSTVPKEGRKGMPAKFRKVNPDWPNNYIQAIKEARKKYDVVLVAQYEEVRKAMAQAGIHYALVFPLNSCKMEFVERYKRRGNPESFVQMLMTNFDKWVFDLYESNDGNKWVLAPGQYLEDMLKYTHLI